MFVLCMHTWVYCVHMCLCIYMLAQCECACVYACLYNLFVCLCMYVFVLYTFMCVLVLRVHMWGAAHLCGVHVCAYTGL